MTDLRCPCSPDSWLLGGYGYAGGIFGDYQMCALCQRVLALEPDVTGKPEAEAASLRDAAAKLVYKAAHGDKQPASRPNRPRVYVASRASLPERVDMWRAYRAEGADILSTWIDEAGEGETDSFGELWSRIEAEIRAADRLVLYAELEDFPLKGALVEAGMAIGMGKPVFVVLPRILLEPRSMRPLGSWAAHPLVRMVSDARNAVFDWEVTSFSVINQHPGTLKFCIPAGKAA